MPRRQEPEPEPDMPIPFPRPIDDGMGMAIALHARVELSSDELTGLIRLVVGRAPQAYRSALRHVSLRLAQGFPRNMAVIGSGINGQTLKDLVRADLVLSGHLQHLEDAGFASSIEAEMYRRAMAGTGDRGSARMLEIIAKSRKPEYREKYGLELSIVQAAESATALVTAGWRDVTPGTDDQFIEGEIVSE